MINDITNFHTHTMLCRHAAGMPADYAKEASAHGCIELGFSDHCPYPADGVAGWTNMRMSLALAPDYIKAVRQEASRYDFPIKAGFECEWDKDFRSWYSDGLLNTLGADYLILGSHWVTLGAEHLYVMEIQDVKTICKYIEQTIEGIKSGIFSFVAHPDIFMGALRDWNADAISLSEAIIDAAVGCGLPLEVNGLGLKRPVIMTRQGERHPYPYLEFWQMAKEKGATVICNSDAHRPQDVIEDAVQSRLFAESAGLKITGRI